ncbi:MAG: heavy metal-associated domain-containing protein, partial [Pseudonocardiaceae bacterium]
MPLPVRRRGLYLRLWGAPRRAERGRRRNRLGHRAPALEAITTTTAARPTATTLRRYEILVGGMTCAACAARVERRLNKLDGVTATVNYATERARVQCPTDTDPRALIDLVQRAG